MTTIARRCGTSFVSAWPYRLGILSGYRAFTPELSLKSARGRNKARRQLRRSDFALAARV